MGIFDSIVGALTGKSDSAGKTDPLVGALGALFEQSGGVQGLMDKFSQGGMGEVFSSWVGTGENQGLDASQLKSVLGSERLQELASKIGIDPDTAAGVLAAKLPGIIDKLTPSGEVDSSAQSPQGLAAMLPSLLQGLGGFSGKG